MLTVISDIRAHRLVNSPVFMVKMIRRLMMVSERRKPVRERWRRKISTAAIPMSETAPSMLIYREMFTICASSVKVANEELYAIDKSKTRR